MIPAFEGNIWRVYKLVSECSSLLRVDAHLDIRLIAINQASSVAFNAIYRKVVLLASAEAVVSLLCTKCTAVSLYASEACLLLVRNIYSLELLITCTFQGGLYGPPWYIHSPSPITIKRVVTFFFWIFQNYSTSAYDSHDKILTEIYCVCQKCVLIANIAFGNYYICQLN
jgi:hypothetical protein